MNLERGFKEPDFCHGKSRGAAGSGSGLQQRGLGTTRSCTPAACLYPGCWLGSRGGHAHCPLHPSPHIAVTDTWPEPLSSSPSLQVRIVPFKCPGFCSRLRDALIPRPFRLICSRPLHPRFIFSEPLKNRQKQVNSP